MAKVLIIGLMLLSFISGSVCGEEATKVSPRQKDWTLDAKEKIDKAIAVMNIIRGDIDELDREGLLEEELSEPPKEPEKWGDDFRKNIDKLIKILQIIRRDVREVEKIDRQKVNYEPKNRL